MVIASYQTHRSERKRRMSSDALDSQEQKNKTFARMLENIMIWQGA